MIFMDNKSNSIKRLAILGPIIAGACWGGCGYFIRGLTDAGLDNPTIVFTREIFGTGLLLVYMLLTDRSGLRIKVRDVPSMLSVTIVGSVFFNFSYNIAVVELSLSLTSVMLATAPVFVLLISAVIFKEKITARKIICMFLAFGGCAMLSGILDPGAEVHAGKLGLLMGICMALCNGVYILTSKNVMTKGYGPLTVCLYIYAFAAVILVPFTDWNALSEFMAVGPSDFIIKGPVGAFIYLLLQSFFSSVLPSITYMLGMKYIDAGKVAILEAGAEPSSALIVGLVIYGELPTPVGFAGMILAILSIMVLARE